MTEQDGQASNVQRPTTDDPDKWKTYWQTQGMPWRTQPEIDQERQRHLGERRYIQVDIEQGIYPFKDIEQKLSRADIEWLLATHQSEGVSGPVTCDDGREPTRSGLDFRGADLTDLDLSHLPLAGIFCGLATVAVYMDAGQHDPRRIAAAACLDRSDLSFTHLEYATLTGASFRGSVLAFAHMERVNALWTDFERAILINTHGEGANLIYARLESVYAAQAHLEGAALSEANLKRAVLEGARLEGASMQSARLDQARCRQARLEGAKLDRAHLEGADLAGASLGGKQMSDDDLKRIRIWVPNFMKTQPPADLRGAFFDSTTNLFAATISDREFGAIALADVHFNGVNLAVLDWRQVEKLRDEHDADENKAELSKLVSPDIWRNSQQGAVRAYRQLAVALREQGMNEEADRFAFRAQKLLRPIFRYDKQGGRWLLSWGLALLAGYGFRLRHILIAYGLALTVFTGIYCAMGVHSHAGEPGIRAVWDSFLVSLSAIHGRTTFEQLGAWSSAAWVAAFESVCGIVIEGIFVAMLIQRFFSR